MPLYSFLRVAHNKMRCCVYSFYKRRAQIGTDTLCMPEVYLKVKSIYHKTTLRITTLFKTGLHMYSIWPMSNTGALMLARTRLELYLVKFVLKHD